MRPFAHGILLLTSCDHSLFGIFVNPAEVFTNGDWMLSQSRTTSSRSGACPLLFRDLFSFRFSCLITDHIALCANVSCPKKKEYRENLVDDRVPERRDSHASSSHEPSLEPTFKRREDLGKHSVYTHYPKDRNCEICQRTKITRAPCRRRTCGAVPRA